MKKLKHAFVVIALIVSIMVPSLPARADTNSDVLALAWSMVTPYNTYWLAINPFVWYPLVNSLLPSSLAQYASLGRTVALARRPTLKPAITWPQSASYTIANSYSQVIAFGDSMSDNGNVYKVSKDLTGWALPMEPYNKGRYTNGLVIVEYMCNFLKLPLLDYAFAGAESSYADMVPTYSLQMGVLQQMDDFISSLGRGSADSNALYFIWAGPDDFYHGVNMSNANLAPSIAANIKTGMIKLYNRGARNFLVPLMPDLSLTPSAQVHQQSDSSYLTNARNRSNELAVAMTTMLKSFAKQYPLAKVRGFDSLTFSRNEYAQAVSDGVNVNDPCYGSHLTPGTACDDPENYLFWDSNHPTDWSALVSGEAFAEAAVAAALPSK